MQKILLAIAALSASLSTSAQQSDGIGYPTVAAALEALKARSDVQVSESDGWTIVNDAKTQTIWSFSPKSHAAHPAAVKRSLIERDGQVMMNMTALCQASKVACDKLMEDFKLLNAQLAQSARSKSAAGKWEANPMQIQRAELQSKAFFAAKDSGEYRKAYAQLADSQKKTISFDEFARLGAAFNATAGKVVSRRISKITWYQNPPNAAPGTYAAVDFSSQFANLGTHCGFLAWLEQPDGNFLMVREEQNYIETSTEKKMTPEQIARARAQFRCHS